RGGSRGPHRVDHLRAAGSRIRARSDPRVRAGLAAAALPGFYVRGHRTRTVTCRTGLLACRFDMSRCYHNQMKPCGTFVLRMVAGLAAVIASLMAQTPAAPKPATGSEQIISPIPVAPAPVSPDKVVMTIG